MKRGTFIALGLSAGTLLFVYSQRRSGAAGEGAVAHEFDPRVSPYAKDPAFRRPLTPKEVLARRTQAAAEAKARLLKSYDTLAAQAAASDTSSVDLGVLDAVASDLRDYGYPEKATVLEQAAARIRQLRQPSPSPLGPAWDRAAVLIAKAKHDVASITQGEADEMARLVGILRGMGRDDVATTLETLLQIRDAYFRTLPPPLVPPSSDASLRDILRGSIS